MDLLEDHQEVHQEVNYLEALEVTEQWRVRSQEELGSPM